MEILDRQERCDASNLCTVLGGDHNKDSPTDV